MAPSDVNAIDPLSAEFWRRVEQVRTSGGGAPAEPVYPYAAAILAVLNRPLTSAEKLAIVDQARANSPGVRLREDVLSRVARGGRA